MLLNDNMRIFFLSISYLEDTMISVETNNAPKDLKKGSWYASEYVITKSEAREVFSHYKTYTVRQNKV